MYPKEPPMTLEQRVRYLERVAEAHREHADRMYKYWQTSELKVKLLEKELEDKA